MSANLLLDRAAAKASSRRFTAETITAMGGLEDAPTTTHATLAGMAVTIEQRPELAHLGAEFYAYFTRHEWISGVARTESGAIDALWEAVEDWDELQRDKRDAERARYGLESGE